MKIWAAAAASALCALACANPCEKLARTVCDRVKEERICEEQRARAKAADKATKDRCKVNLKNVDKFVAGLTKVAELKAMLRNFGHNLLQQSAAPSASAPPAPTNGPPAAAPAVDGGK